MKERSTILRSRWFKDSPSYRDAIKLLSEIQSGISELKPRLNAYNKRFEYKPYEYDKGIYVIDISKPIGYIEGMGKNMLLYNFWALLGGILARNDNTDLVDTGGTKYAIKISATFVYSEAVIAYGRGTTPESFTDYRLVSEAGTISCDKAVTVLPDRSRLSLSGVIPVDGVTEIGVRQDYVYETTAYTFLLARKTGSFVKDQAVVWRIDFLAPWVKQLPDLLAGVFARANRSMTITTGSTATIAFTGAFVASSSWVVASPTLASWTPDAYSVPNAFDMTSFVVAGTNGRQVRATYIHGYYKPTSDTEVNTVGLYQRLNDTGRTARTVCYLVNPLSSPITFYANKTNVVVIRLIASG